MQQNTLSADVAPPPPFFEGQDLRVILRMFERDPDLFITFTGRAANPPVPTGFGETFFQKRGLSAVHFISKANHWWQTGEVDEAIAALREAGVLTGKRRITLYGSSMGGYAALVRSVSLNPTQILAVSPQYSIDGKVVPFERRWRHYAAKLRFEHDDMAAGLDLKARILVVVDSFFSPDAQHLQLIESHRPVEVVRISFAGHNTARALEEIGLATRLVTEVARGDFDNISFCRDYRRGRVASCLFWYGLASYLAERGRRGWALSAATLAAHLLLSGTRMRDQTLHRDILDMALELACEAKAAPLASRWLEAMERSQLSQSALTLARARVALASGKSKEAMAHVRELLAEGADEESYAVVVDTLNANKRYGKAGGMLERAAASGSVAFLLAAGRMHRDHGDPEVAVELLSKAIALGPRAVEARILLATIHLTAGRPAAARTVLGVAGSSVPASPDMAEQLARIVTALDGEDAASRAQKRAARMAEFQRRLAAGLHGIEPAAPAEGVRALLGAASAA